MKAKHGKTKVEKIKDITNEFLGFEMKSDESAEAFLDRTENLVTKCRKEKLKDNLEYMIANTMVEKAFKAGKLTKEERVKLQDSIEVEEMNDRVPKSENDVFEKLRKEFRKLKIENNRDAKDETNETKNIHYGERKSRFEEWKRFKSNPEYNDYERSGSMPGFWRSKSGNNYKRAPSRTPSRRFDRSGSFRKDKNHVTLAEKVSKIEQSVKNIENILAKKGNETKETLYIKEFRYVKEKKNEMVLDSGAPVATVGDDWLEEYIKEHEIDEKKLVKTKSNQKFRFGPSQIYTAKEVTEIPITLKNAKTNEFVKTKIPVYVVEAKNVPLLIGKNILNEWEAAWNIPKGKLRIKIDGKPLEIEVQEKSGGHSVVVIDPEPVENDIKEVRYVNIFRIETKENNMKIEQEESDKAENEVIKLLFDPNVYCKLCDGNLLGIRHLVECRRKSEKAAEDETGEKEDNSEKVNRVEDKETAAKLTPEESKSVLHKTMK